MNPYEAVFKAVMIVWGAIGLGFFIGWVLLKLKGEIKNGKRNR